MRVLRITRTVTSSAELGSECCLHWKFFFLKKSEDVIEQDHKRIVENGHTYTPTAK